MTRRSLLGFLLVAPAVPVLARLEPLSTIGQTRIKPKPWSTWDRDPHADGSCHQWGPCGVCCS